MLLETRALTASYGQFRALFGVDVTLDKGETVAVIGANGAGKSTLLRSITGVLRNAPDMVLHRGDPIGALPAHLVMQRGIAMVPEGRKLFPSLTVEENLRIGGQVRRAPGPWTLDTIYTLFPILKEKRQMPGTALSGGQQQMVAIGRAMMSNPQILMLDEPSLGIAPKIVSEIAQAIKRLNQETGVSVILVEQNARLALKMADDAYVFEQGLVIRAGSGQELLNDPFVQKAFLGI